eukprot:gene9732-8675_t
MFGDKLVVVGGMSTSDKIEDIWCPPPFTLPFHLNRIHPASTLIHMHVQRKDICVLDLGTFEWTAHEAPEYGCTEHSTTHTWLPLMDMPLALGPSTHPSPCFHSITPDPVMSGKAPWDPVAVNPAALHMLVFGGYHNDVSLSMKDVTIEDLVCAEPRPPSVHRVPTQGPGPRERSAHI